MRRRINNGFSISFAACVVAAFFVLIVPLRWIVAAVFAGLIHELCHYWMIRLCGGIVDRITIDWDGITMDTSALSPGKEFLCTFAGPAGELCLMLAFRHLPRTAVCALFHAAYNLLPVYPLDGGRILKCVLEILLPKQAAEKTADVISTAITWLLILFGIAAAIWMNLGIMPVIFAFILWKKSRSRKIPCKPAQQRVQYTY